MKKCCKKWKESKIIAYDKKEQMIADILEKLFKFAVRFCPECGSSLKEVEIEGTKRTHFHWCDKCAASDEDCNGCKDTSNFLQPPTDYKLKQESKWCECEDRSGQTIGGKGNNYCHDCDKPIKPKPHLPEKISLNYLSYKCGHPHTLLAETINQILDYLKGLEERNEELLEEIKNFERGEP